MAIVSLYVALLDETITQLIMKTPPDTHLKEPAIPMILRYADIPEITSLVAPRQVIHHPRHQQPVCKNTTLLLHASITLQKR
jgi:hypothetical protein